MKRKFHLLLFLLPLQLNAQQSQSSAYRLLMDVSILATRNAAGGLSYDDIDGSPHYPDVFVQSTVYLKDDNSATLPLRYDLFQDEIEFMRDGKILWLIKRNVLYIKYGEEMLINEPSSSEPGKSSYFFAQGSGKYALYHRKKVSYYPKVPPKAYAEAIPDRFEQDRDVYYLKEENKPVQEIKSKKNLSAILAENEPALKFIQRSKIKVTRPEDLLKLVEFLNNQ